MNNKIILKSLAMDLKRVALGYYRGSELMAKRFAEEAKTRKEELQNADLKPYIINLLLRMDDVLKQKDHKKLAEDCLMYSTLFQNASLRK